MSVTVSLDVPKIIENSEEANRRAVAAMAEQVLADSNQLCPLGESAALRGSAIVNSDLENGIIKWATPYAQNLYYGLLMVAPNGSAWAKLGERKHVKEPNVKLDFSEPGTMPLWFEKAKDVHLDEWNRGYLIIDEHYGGRITRKHWSTNLYSAYVDNVNQCQADGTLIDYGIIKSSSFIIELLSTPIGNAAKNGEKIWWDSKIGIYSNGTFYNGSHAVAIRNRPGDPLDSMYGMTSYNRITTTKYSDDYHEYDP